MPSTTVAVPSESYVELMKTFGGFCYPMSSVGIPYLNYSSATTMVGGEVVAQDGTGYGAFAIGLSLEGFTGRTGLIINGVNTYPLTTILTFQCAAVAAGYNVMTIAHYDVQWQIDEATGASKVLF
jgi:hypothetical protein